MDPIEISSSDSDFDWGDEEEDAAPPSMPSVASTSYRVLPEWASTSGMSARADGPRGQSQQVSSVRGLNGNSKFSESHPFSNGATTRPLNAHIISVDDTRNSKGNGGAAGRVHSAKSDRTLEGNSSRNAYDQTAIQQSVKRTLPSSLQPSLPVPRKNYSFDSEGSNQILGNGRSMHSPMPTGLTSRNYKKDNDVVMHDNPRSRVLPPSLMHGRSLSSSPYAGSSDPVYHSGVADERVSGPDERFVYQAALQDLSQPRIEANLPDGLLSVPLLRHQKIALAWMLQRESRTFCVGGILADDQGLGKTISTIALIEMQRYLLLKAKSEEQGNHKAEAFNLDDDEDGHNAESLTLLDDESTSAASAPNTLESENPDPVKRHSKKASSSRQASSKKRPAAGTLIVCPATVLRQWARELDDKVADEGKLSILVYHGGNRTRDPSELAKYDVVLTTYSIITNEVPKQPLVDEEDGELKNGDRYGLSSDFSSNKKRKKPSEASKKGKRGRKGAACSVDGNGGALARVVWFRVVLDEAQTIKNHRTQVARACCGLRAKKRWCLSGTPIQNAIDELYSYFRFLRYDPYAAYKSFIEGIKAPIARDSQYGYKKLQAVLKAVMLRRTKETLIDGEPIISLPPKLIKMQRVNFTIEERSFYAQLEAESRSQFKAYAAAGTVSQNYANILLLLLRLRQACDHPLLAQGYSSGIARRSSIETAKQLSNDKLVKLLNQLETSAICCACSDPPEDAVVTICGHVFCYQCVSDYCTSDEITCPVPRCRGQLSSDVVFPEATLRSCLSMYSDCGPRTGDQHDKNSLILKTEYCSSKIRAALEILQSLCKLNGRCIDLESSSGCNNDSSYLGEVDAWSTSVGVNVRTDMKTGSSLQGPRKAIVFSQWTRMLDLFEHALNEYSIKYRRLDGTMSLASRDRAVREFNINPEVTVMLMSLKAGNLGLNMVAACHVILLDLWWNPTTEDQAVDRAHRIGQTRPVTVSRITIKDTVEDRILALQEEKRKLVASAFGEDHSGGSGSRLTVDDLRYLFMGGN